MVHDLGHRGACIRCNLDEVEVSFVSQTQSVFYANNSDLFASRTHKTDLGDADSFVNAGFVADGASSVVPIHWST